jgi:hypothetical protein
MISFVIHVIDVLFLVQELIEHTYNYNFVMLRFP